MPDKIVNHFVLADGSTAKYDATQLAGDVPEVVDIRTGYDGTVYDSAGDAVREQVEKLNDGLDSISEGMTTFINPQFSTYSATTLSEIDKSFQFYDGYIARSDGTFLTGAYNSYALVCPHDGFTFRTNVGRLLIARDYPNVDDNTVEIKSVLSEVSNGIGDMSVVRTVANRGDIIVISCPKSLHALYLTQENNLAVINNLALSETNELFSKYTDFLDDAVSYLGNEKLSITKIESALITSTTGGYTENASYNTYYFQVPVETLTIKCTNGFRACLGYEAPSLTSDVYNLKTLLYGNAGARVETFTANYHEWVVITVAKSQGEIDIQTNYINTFSMPALRLNYMQGNSFYNYIVDGTAKRLYIYYKSGGKYVRWELHNAPTTSINSNTWQLGAVYGLDGELSNPVELVTGGEFELALKEHGASDYCGGNNHGDETTDTFHLFIDGKAIDDLSLLSGAYVSFNRIDAIEVANINRCDTPAEDIAKHQKVWTFENGTVKVKQSIEFLQQLQIDGMLICMLASNRSAFNYGVRQGKVGIETMTDSTYSIIRTQTNDMFYEMYGENATAKITAKSFNGAGYSGLWINPTSALNKLYYTYWENSNPTFPATVNANETLHWESEYNIAYD